MKISQFLRSPRLRYIINPLSLILLIVILMSVVLGMGSENQVYVQYSHNVSFDSLTTKGLELNEDGSLTSIDDDPRIYIGVTDQAINMIRINFGLPLSKPSDAALYYSTDGTGLSEAKKYKASLAAGDTCCEIPLNADTVFTQLRFDMSGTYYLDSIDLNRESTVYVSAFNAVYFIVTFCVSAVVYALYIITCYQKNKLGAEEFRRRSKKYLNPVSVTLLVLIILSALLGLHDQTDESIQYSVSIPLDTLTTKGLTVEKDGAYHSINNDPQLHIPTCSQKIDLVKITFDKPVSDSTTAQLYYSINDPGLSEARVIHVKIKSGDTAVYIELPKEAVYTILRFDMSGTYYLGGIELCHGTVKKHSAFNPLPMILAVVLSAAIYFLYIRKQDSVNAFFASAGHRLSSKILTEKGFEPSEKYKKKLVGVYLTTAIVFGCLIIFITPPMATPDEYVHYNYAVQLSRFEFFPNIVDGALGITNTYDEVSLNRMDHMDSKTAVQLSYDSSNLGLDGFYRTNGVGSPIGYMVSGFGIALVRMLVGGYLSPYTTLLVGRIVNLIFSSVVIAIAIKNTKALTNTMFLIALMPMTIFQCSSLSYDAVIIPFSMLLFGYATKILRSDEGYKVTTGDIIAVSASCFFLFGAKGAVYAPLVLVLFALSYKKFKSVKQYICCITGEIILSLASYGIPTVIGNRLVSAANITEDIVVSEQRSFLFSHLSLIPDIINKTWVAWGRIYLEGFVGRLGPKQEVRMPHAFIAIFTLILVIVAVTEICSLSKVNINMRLFAFIGFCISFLGIHISMYLGYAPLKLGVGGLLAFGVQGRYFIPLPLFLMIIFANPLLHKFKKTRDIMAVESQIAVITGLCSCAITAFVLFAKFWL